MLALGKNGGGVSGPEQHTCCLFSKSLRLEKQLEALGQLTKGSGATQV